MHSSDQCHFWGTYGVSEVSLKHSGQIKLLEHSCFRMPSLRKKSASPRDYVVGYAIPGLYW